MWVVLLWATMSNAAMNIYVHLESFNGLFNGKILNILERII